MDTQLHWLLWRCQTGPWLPRGTAGKTTSSDTINVQTSLLQCLWRMLTPEVRFCHATPPVSSEKEGLEAPRVHDRPRSPRRTLEIEPREASRIDSCGSGLACAPGPGT